MERWFCLMIVGWAMLRAGAAPAVSGPDRVERRREAADPPAPPAGALGYPSRAADLDVLTGFRNPPPGYGEVPFWWWTGDPLDRDRLLWQIEELHRKGVSGVQVNYAHEDTPGWPTYAVEPPIFSEGWWDVWKFVAGECGRRGMGVGLSGYTLDWPNGRSLVSRTIYSDPEIAGREVRVASRTKVRAMEKVRVPVPPGTVGAWAYPVVGDRVDPRGLPLRWSAGAAEAEWDAGTARDWEIWVYEAVAKAGALDPMHPLSGRRVIEKFFQPFQDHAPGKSAAGLDYFFQDELQFGVGDHAWTADLPEQFRARKGYDLFEALPAMFGDVGPRTPKARLDFMEVRGQLIQERYFMPIFDWHWSRGLIYGCDQGSRGLDPGEFGDYFGAVRWYTAPGHDTPGGRADAIKGKVSSSIAHLYRRPRVWLEGYHSLGWSAAPERLMEATCENYLYGCNLLNLHGLYYSTHGGYWEWAPPSYHFRMPYWEHMGVFLKYFERLSFLLSQGVHQSDIAVLYPVTPGQAGLGGKEAAGTAFATGRELLRTGRDFIYMDDESLARAEIAGGRLLVSEAAYRVLILPAMRAVRWATLEKAADFRQAGGLVVAIGALPEASDRDGREDPELDALVREIWGATAAEVKAGRDPGPRRHASGGVGIVLPDGDRGWPALKEALREVPPDVAGTGPVRALHRRIGARDVYWVMGAGKGAEVTFRAKGRVEEWDPWTGEARPLPAAVPVEGGTRVRLPRGAPEAQLIVFSPGQPDLSVAATDLEEVSGVDLRDGRVRVTGFAATPGGKRAMVDREGGRVEVHGEAAAGTTLGLEGPWDFELQPTLDNRWGDFRLPVDGRMIGAEARLFRHAEPRSPGDGPAAPAFDDSGWERVTYGFGPKFWKLGPLPAGMDVEALEREWAALSRVDPAVPIELGGRRYSWEPYAFSWRWGREGDPGHQGYHGLKENVTDDFLCLGKPTEGHNETVYREEPGGGRYFLWTSAVMEEAGRVRVHLGGLAPAALYVNGKAFPGGTGDLALGAGPNPLLLRYDSPGRGHVVLQRLDAGPARPRTPLAMRWFDEAGIVPFDVHGAGPRTAGWYRFVAPPGFRAMTVTARGEVEAWVEGRPCRLTALGAPGTGGGARRFRGVPEVRGGGSVLVALRILPEPGESGGSALPEPIALECGAGRSLPGDWSQGSVLENYSGGAWYRKDVVLDDRQVRGRVRLHLGEVVATAEVRVNGQRAGIRVAPPWFVDLGPLVRPGTNRLEILVYNTLANHYLTIPTRYRGDLKSGLIGPVRLELQPEVVLE